MHNNMPPIDIEIKLIFARFVSLPSLISFSVRLFIVLPPNIKSSSETENNLDIDIINSRQANIVFPI